MLWRLLTITWKKLKANTLEINGNSPPRQWRAETILMLLWDLAFVTVLLSPSQRRHHALLPKPSHCGGQSPLGTHLCPANLSPPGNLHLGKLSLAWALAASQIF